MWGRNTDTVIKGLEGEIERLSAKLRKAYDTHAETVAKFERDFTQLKRELDSAYHLSAQLTSEKAHLAGAANDVPDYAAQVENQLRALTIGLKKANEERCRAEERVVELEAGLEASERVATQYVSALHQTEQECTSAREDVQRLSLQIAHLTTARDTSPADGADNQSDGSSIGLDSNYRGLQQLVISAQNSAKESRNKLTQLEERYAASAKQVAQLTAELAQVNAGINGGLRDQPNAVRADAAPAPDAEELTELRSRIEAAEYILADYQAKLKQAEIDRDEALRDLKQVTTAQRSPQNPNDPRADSSEPDTRGPRLNALALELALEKQQRVDQESDNKRLRARIASAETLASKSMARAKAAEAEHKKALAEIASVNALLETSRSEHNTIDVTTDNAFAVRLHDAEAARVRAEQESFALQQQLAVANARFESFKKSIETIETARAAEFADEARDAQQLAELRANKVAEDRRIFEENIAEMQARIRELEEHSISAEEQARQALDAKETVTRDLENRLTALQETANQNENAAREYRMQRDRANENVQMYSAKVMELENISRQVLDDNEALRDQRRQFETDQQSTQEAVSRLVEQVAAKETQLAQLTREQAALVTERGRLVEELDLMSERLASAENIAAEKQSSLENNAVSVEDHARMAADLAEAIQGLHAQLTIAQDMQNQLTALRETTSQAKRAAEHYRLQGDQANGQVQMLSAKVQELENSNRQMLGENESLKDQCGQAETDQQRTQQEANELVEQLAAKEIQIAQLTKQQRRLARELDLMTERLASAGTIVARQQAIIEALNQERTANQKTDGDVETAIASVSHQLTNANEFIAESEQNEPVLKQSNEAVEKPAHTSGILQLSFLKLTIHAPCPDEPHFSSIHRSSGSTSSCQFTVILQLLDVVYHTIQLPLSLDLSSPAQAEAFETFVGTDIGKHRLDHRHAMTIYMFALCTVHPMFHPVGVAGCPCRTLDDERDLPTMTFAGVGRGRVTQARLFQVARTALG